VKPEEIILGKTCFVQGLHSERLQSIIRSRRETLRLSQAIDLSLEKSAQSYPRKKDLLAQLMGPPSDVISVINLAIPAPGV
jgi:hypothetical protein